MPSTCLPLENLSFPIAYCYSPHLTVYTYFKKKSIWI